MEVNVIFAEKVSVNEKNNFSLDFKYGNIVMELLLNRKKDYYINNAITYLEQNKYENKVTDLETIAKKHLDIEKTEKYEFTFLKLSIYLNYNPNGRGIYETSWFKTYEYEINKNEIKKHQKTYKYLNTNTHLVENFKVYDFYAHLKQWINYNLKNTKENAPSKTINLKLNDAEDKILTKCVESDDLSFRFQTYSWYNTIMTHNPSTGEWYYSKRDWIEILRRLNGLKSITQEALSSSLRSAFAQYFLREPDSKVICHEDNYSKLTFVKQLFTPFTVTKNGYLRLTVRTARHIYVVVDSNFHRKNTENFMHSSTQYAGTIYKHAGISKTIPYDTLHKYLLESFNRDDYWFDHNTFLIDERYSVSKNLYIENPASIVKAKNFGWFVGNEKENKLTSTELADIKKFNKFEKEVEEANIKGFEDGSA